MFEVVYFSRSGNTKKVAEAIADELGVKAKDIKTAGAPPADAFVFLGTGCYGAMLPAHIARYMNRFRFSGRKITLFTTSAFGAVAERSMIEKQIRDKGADITANFQCTGQWLTMKKDHPNGKELESAREFARSLSAKQLPPATAKVKEAVLTH
jgi:flavodoxin